MSLLRSKNDSDALIILPLPWYSDPYLPSTQTEIPGRSLCSHFIHFQLPPIKLYRTHKPLYLTQSDFFVTYARRYSII